MKSVVATLVSVGLMAVMPAFAQQQTTTTAPNTNPVVIAPPSAQTDSNTTTTITETNTGATNTLPSDSQLVENEPNAVTITSDAPAMRTERETFNFFRFGPSSLMNLGSDGAGIFLSGGQIYNTHPQAAVRISLDTAFNPGDGEGTATYISGNLGGNYYINNADYSPHVFADLGYGYANGPGVDSSNGFTLGVGAGASFFRTTDMQMDLSARYQLLMDSNDVGTPGILALLLGLNFG